MSEQTVERYTVEKQKVRSADIVVRYTVDKPYYEIKYQDNDGAWRIGYGSYKLENVYCWLNECFEIVSYDQEIRDKVIEKFVKEAMKQFTEFDLKHGYPTLADCKMLLREIAKKMKNQ